MLLAGGKNSGSGVEEHRLRFLMGGWPVDSLGDGVAAAVGLLRLWRRGGAGCVCAACG